MARVEADRCVLDGDDLAASMESAARCVDCLDEPMASEMSRIAKQGWEIVLRSARTSTPVNRRRRR
jgi:hypothetical protein